MFGVFILCFFAAVMGVLSVYTPPSQELVLRRYLQSRERRSEGRSKAITADPVELQKALEFMRQEILKNVSGLRQANETSRTSSKVFNDLVRRSLLNPFLSGFESQETTTYKYPTATWTADYHEKLKEEDRKQSKLYLFKPSPFLKPPFTDENDLNNIDDGVVLSKGKIKSLDSDVPEPNLLRVREIPKTEDFLDKFLEQSLYKYLESSNLKYSLGDVSVNAFSEALKDVTKENKTSKATEKKYNAPYDRNKELRIKFRDEVFSKKKAEAKPHAGILEKQLQKRLEKMLELNEKSKLIQWTLPSANKTEIAENMSKTETTTEKTETTTEAAPTDVIETTTLLYENVTEQEIFLTSTAATTTQEPKTVRTARRRTRKPVKNVERSRKRAKDSDDGELKLSVAETVYYRKRQLVPVQPVYVEEESSGVIPGIPDVDYPMYSQPPDTGFKCPSGVKGDRPTMMADVQTRCQVFYICTGDGPASPVLCPNGTMFNENVLVCDWWYNVNC